LFIIAAPLLVLALALLTFHFVSPGDAAALIILVHMVMTVAHHLPTFIRIYGDVDLFQRFKWTFLLGPLVPLTFAAGAPRLHQTFTTIRSRTFSTCSSCWRCGIRTTS